MKKKFLVVIIFLYKTLSFSLEVRTNVIVNGAYNKIGFWTRGVKDCFFTEDDELVIKSSFHGDFIYSVIENKDAYEIDLDLYNKKNAKRIIYNSQLSYGYYIYISDDLIAYENSSPDPRQRNYNPDPLYFYIKDKKDEIIFNFNQWKLNHEEYYPRSYYNSLSEKIFYTDEGRERIMKINAVYTVKDLYCINKEKNKIAIILDNYNSEGACALIIFDILYNATVNDLRVRLRSEPNLESQTLSYFYTGDDVKIIAQSDEKYEIDGESWYWYKVESGSYPVGWVYGKYLDIEKE